MTFVQAWRADAATSGNSLVVAVNPTAARLLVVHVAFESGSTDNVTLTDPSGGTYVRAINTANAGQVHQATVFYVLSCAGGSRNITINFPTNRPNRSVRVEEHSGIAAFIAATTVNYQASPTTTPGATTSGNVNVTSQPAWLIGCSKNWGAGTPPPTAVNGNNNGAGFDYLGADYARFSDRRVTATGNAALTFTAPSNVMHITYALAFTEAAAGPSITSVGTIRNGASYTITGTNFGATQGSSTVTLNGVTQTVTSWSATSITCTNVRGGTPYGVNVNLTVTVSSVGDTEVVQLLPQTGWDYINVGTPNADDTIRLTGTPDVESTDQVAWETMSGAVVVYSDLTWDADESVTGFPFEIWDNDDDTWGTSGTQTVTDPVGEIDGDLAVTEAQDTVAVSGEVAVEGVLAVTEALDTIAVTVEIVVTAALAVTEAADTVAISAAVAVQGALEVSEGIDTIAVSAAVIVAGALAVTEANDTILVNGGADRSATLAVTEEPDTIAVSGAVAVEGLLAVSEAQDTIAVDVDVLVVGSFAVTEAADSVAVNGDVLIEGTLAVTEAADTVFINGGSSVTGLLAVTEAPDTSAISGQVLVQGALAITEGAMDGFAAVGEVPVEGALAVTEASDSIAVNGSSAHQATFAVTEAMDGFAAAGEVFITGEMTASDSPDSFAAAGRVAIEGLLAVMEASDTVAITTGSLDRGVDIEMAATYTPRILLSGSRVSVISLSASQD
jgi:hypothetical protein